MLEWIRNTLYVEKFDQDARVSSLTFDIPYTDSKIGLVGFDPIYWAQLFVLVSLQAIVNVLVALIIYEFIITKPKNSGHWTPYLVGYGLICPLMVAFPFWYMDELGVQNKAMTVGAAASGVLLILRCFEAMYDTVPPFATKSRSSFVLYYACTVQFEFDPKTGEVVRATFMDIVRKLVNFISLFFQALVVFSLLFPVNYELLSISDDSTIPWSAFAHLVNNFAMASLTSICLDVGATGIGMGTTTLTGLNTVALNDHPLSKSQSPSEFWNKRWNVVVSHGLKRAVFVPLKKNGFSKPFAALATFVASGLMHEYILFLISYSEFKEMGHISFSGTHLAFFAWNGVVSVLEHFFKDHTIIRWISKTFPKPIKTALVILTVLPLAHLFTQIYADSGFYTAFGLGFPRIELIR